MKKMFLPIAIIIAILVLTGCLNSSNNLSMKVNSETLTNKSATVVIKNDSKNTYNYAEEYWIEIKKDNKWGKLNPIEDMVFIEIMSTLKPGDKREFNIDFETYYGELKAGKYRVVKTYYLEPDNDKPMGNENMLYAEFEIK